MKPRVDQGPVRLALLLVVLAALCWLAPSASALLVQKPDGQILGITLHANVNPGSIRGSLAGLRGKPSGFSANGNLDYHNGAVLHSTAPYLIFWDPSRAIPASSRTLMTRYFTDVAADGGKATNVYSVDRQFTDSTGFADYSQTFVSGHAIVDTQAYPTRDTTNCPDVNPTFYPTCVTDTQIHTELTRLLAADSLPSGTGANAPIYLVVTPSNVNECSDASDCADNAFCAYHSSYVNGGPTVLYAAIPLLPVAPRFNPKACQDDGNTAVQKPNGDLADVAIKYMSHEDNETITDPVNGGGWWDAATGQEDGDNCNFNGGFSPANGTNPNAFLPTLGGTAAGGNLFNQVINTDHYYIQSEWSNGDVNCEMQPSAGAIAPSFTVPSGVRPGVPTSFNPAATTSSQGYTSVTWNFGDGSAPSFSRISATPRSISHTFASTGFHTVSMTLVDTKGNLATVIHPVTVGTDPTAAFTVGAATPLVGQSVLFDGGGSSDLNTGGSVSSYAWNFGDGSPAGSGATPSHAFATPGTHTVSLVVTDNFGLSSSPVTHQVNVLADPSPSFTVTTATPAAGQSVSFDGRGSADPNGGSIASYAWSFGDGSAPGTGSTPTHAYAAGGTYTVTLSVTDTEGGSATVSHQVKVDGLPSAAFAVKTSHPASGTGVLLDAASSSSPNGSIASYSWSFGDGSAAGSGVSPKHTFKKPGGYRVKLTVTDSAGLSASVSHSVEVALGGQITKVSTTTKRGSQLLVIKVSGPGVLTVGGKRYRIRKAGTTKVPITLSRAELAHLHKHHKLRLKLRLKWVPTQGATFSKTETVTLKS